jgi:uncharacterized membrane protein SpoIIM required for sporulation
MKETRFIAQNKEKWQESENLLKDSHKDPEKLSNLFTQVVDDLSYSRTYYPNRSVRVYLNKIAREYFSIIYSHQKEKKNIIKSFWLDELPQIVIYCRKPLLISFFIFLFAAAIGVFSAIKDPQFTSTILGDSYVTMTKANIEKGDPMAVYKESHQVDMFLGITLNNLMVAFRTYVFGIFLSIGTVAILLYNGIMVGCFQFFFIERGLFAESALTIWLHGTLEISSIILAGGAGLTLGSGLIFPGTYSRLQSFQISAIRSLKLMLGITPIFVLAAIIESFLTRYTETPDIVRLFFILFSAFLIVGYFVVYPWLKSRQGFEHPLVEVKLPSSIDSPLEYDRIKNGAEIIKDTFLFYKKYANKLLSWVVLVTLIMTVAEFILPEPRNALQFLEDQWESFFKSLYYALKTPFPLFILINTIGTSLIVYRVFMLLHSDANNTLPKLVEWKTFIQTIIIIGAMYGMIYKIEGFGTFLLVFSFALFLLYAFTQLTENVNLLGGLVDTLKLCMGNFGRIMGLQFILLLMSFSFLLILSAPLLYINTSILEWNFAKSDVWSKSVIQFIEIFIKLFAFNLIIPVFAGSVANLYFSLREVVTAEHLKRSIALIGNKSSKKNKR